jgi:hypothetical protein
VGSATVRARVATGSGTDSVDVTIGITVTNYPTSINITTADQTKELQDTLNLATTITNGLGNALGKSSATWFSTSTSVVTVSDTGLVIAQGVGTAYVKAVSAGNAAVRDSVLFTVNNTADTVTVNSVRDTLIALGQQLTYSATVKNKRGQVISGASVTWATGDAVLVEVDATGTITAIGFTPDSVEIVATSAAKKDTVKVYVKNTKAIYVDKDATNSPHHGTQKYPFLKIQDGIGLVDAADDTVFVSRTATPYSEAVAIDRSLFLRGRDTTDAGCTASGCTTPASLPTIGHNGGAAGITLSSGITATIRHLALVHTVDGPAITGDGATLRAEFFHVNPSATATEAPVGRGIYLRNDAGMSRIRKSGVRAVKGYGIRLETMTGARVDSVTIVNVDSITGVSLPGAGIQVTGGATDTLTANTVSGTEGPRIRGSSTSALIVVRNSLSGRKQLIQLVSVTGTSRADSNTLNLDRITGENGDDNKGSADDGRSGIEITTSNGVTARSNKLTETTVAMDAVRLRSSQGVTLRTDTMAGGRYSIRADTTNVTSDSLVSTSAVTAFFLASADTLTSTKDSISGATDVCVSLAGGKHVATFTTMRANDCAVNKRDAFSVNDGGAKTAHLKIENSMFLGVDRRLVNFVSGQALRLVGDTLVGDSAAGTAFPNDSAVINVVSADTVTMSTSLIRHFARRPALRVNASDSAGIKNNLFSRNRSGLVFVTEPTTFAVSSNDVYDQLSFLGADSLPDDNAVLNNWWGDGDAGQGPRRFPGTTAADTAATGDSVAFHVAFSPTFTGNIQTAPNTAGGAADSLRSVRGNGETVATLTDSLRFRALTVRVVDANGLPVNGASVTFTITNCDNDGLLTDDDIDDLTLLAQCSVTKTTNTSGLAEARPSFGVTANTRSITAVAAGKTVTFSVIRQ